MVRSFIVFVVLLTYSATKASELCAGLLVKKESKVIEQSREAILKATRNVIESLDSEQMNSPLKLRQLYFETALRLGISNVRATEVLETLVKRGLVRGQLHEANFFKGLQSLGKRKQHMLDWTGGYDKKEIEKLTRNLVGPERDPVLVNTFIEKMVSDFDFKQDKNFGDATGFKRGILSKNMIDDLSNIHHAKDREEIKILIQLIYKATLSDMRKYALHLSSGNLTKNLDFWSAFATPIASGVAAAQFFSFFDYWLIDFLPGFLVGGLLVDKLSNTRINYFFNNMATTAKRIPLKTMRYFELRRLKRQLLVGATNGYKLSAPDKKYDFRPLVNIRELNSIRLRAKAAELESNDLISLNMRQNVDAAIQDQLNVIIALGNEALMAAEADMEIMNQMVRTFNVGLSGQNIDELPISKDRVEMLGRIHAHVTNQKEDLDYVMNWMLGQIEVLATIKSELEMQKSSKSNLEFVSGLKAAFERNFNRLNSSAQSTSRELDEKYNAYRLFLAN